MKKPKKRPSHELQFMNPQLAPFSRSARDLLPSQKGFSPQNSLTLQRAISMVKNGKAFDKITFTVRKNEHGKVEYYATESTAIREVTEKDSSVGTDNFSRMTSRVQSNFALDPEFFPESDQDPESGEPSPRFTPKNDEIQLTEH